MIAFILIASGLNWEKSASHTIIEEKCLYLAGVLSLSFFVHNFVLNVTRTANPATAKRDVSIGFWLGGLSYTAVGLIGYLALGSDITAFQDFLDYFSSTDIFAMTARGAVVLQMTSVLPLVATLMRCQIFTVLLKKEYPGIIITLVYSVSVLITGWLFAVFYPQVGDVIRYTGAACGFVLASFMH